MPVRAAAQRSSDERRPLKRACVGNDRTGISGTSLAFNLTWHDWLNLKSLILVSRAITAASLARAESRGAHFRSDFPGTEPDDGAAFTKVRLEGDDMALDWERVRFTRIKPGDTLLNP